MQGIGTALAQFTDQVEALSGLRVRLLTQGHGKGPGTLGHHQRDVQVADISLGAHQVSSGDVALLKVPLIGLRQFQDLPEAGDATRAVATVPLVVPETDAVLLLPVTDQAEDWKGERGECQWLRAGKVKVGGAWGMMGRGSGGVTG